MGERFLRKRKFKREQKKKTHKKLNNMCTVWWRATNMSLTFGKWQYRNQSNFEFLSSLIWRREDTNCIYFMYYMTGNEKKWTNERTLKWIHASGNNTINNFIICDISHSLLFFLLSGPVRSFVRSVFKSFRFCRMIYNLPYEKVFCYNFNFEEIAFWRMQPN